MRPIEEDVRGNSGRARFNLANVSSWFLLDGRLTVWIEFGTLGLSLKRRSKRVLPGKERVKELRPFDLTGHILASFLTMSNIFLHWSKIIDSIEES